MGYIDADKLINELEPVVKSAAFKNRNIRSNVNKCLEIVNNQPTADVVEVVRCKECKHLDKGENDSESWCECTRIFGTYFDVSEDDFCSYGERADA